MVKHTRDCVSCGGVLNKTRSRPINVCTKCKHEAWKARAIERGVDLEAKARQKIERRLRVFYTTDGSRAHLTAEQFNLMLEAQGGVCANCKEPETIHDVRGGVKNLCVDHCHTTGKIRGLLCGRCNKGIGCLGDDIAGLERALAYLRQTEGV